MSIALKCSIRDCEKEQYVKRFCRMHYARHYRYGSPYISKNIYRLSSKCSVDGCDRKPKAKNLCNMHWYRRYRYGEVGSNQPIQFRHGESLHPLYKTWEGMRNRCNNKNYKQYKDYGGRGIKVCERWNNFGNFIKDMGDKPSPDYSIDRIDVNGNYEPSNCRWATWKQQALNKRKHLI